MASPRPPSHAAEPSAVPAAAPCSAEEAPGSVWLDMQDPNTHRELVANVGNLKASVRGVILAVSRQPSSRLPGVVQRAHESVNNLKKLLLSVSDQTARLPLETSRRLVEVDLADLCQQLLSSCNPAAQWPAPGSDQEEDFVTVAALQHPSWPDVQLLVAQVFQVLTLLCGVAVRACTRSPDPQMVLMQLASPKAMDACVAYMQQLWQLHSAGAAPAAASSAQAGISDTAAVSASSGAAPAPSHMFAATVAAFSSCYSLLASAVDVQPGLEELELQLVSSLCSTNFLAVAVQLLLAADRPSNSGAGALETDCQQAGWQLLTLALFLSGGDIASSPAGSSCSVVVSPGQHVPSSVLAEQMRLADKQQHVKGVAAAAVAAAADNLAAAQAATGLPLATMQQQLLDTGVLQFLQERLHHAVREMCISSTSSGGNLLQQLPFAGGATAAAAAAEEQQVVLLPGRCAPDDQDVLTAALRTLRCWRALLVGPAGPCLPLASSAGLGLLLAVLRGALAESIKAGSSEREALRGRLIRVTVHCLQLLCSFVPREVLLEQLFSLTAALSGVVGAAGAFWDANKRAVKSADLPYTGQVRCVDKTTGDMMVRYTMAAQSALAVLLQLVASCRDDCRLAAQDLMSVVLSAGLLPAVEKLFRQLPVVSPAHVTAADLLSQVLPQCQGCDLSAGQLPLLATLRKFLVKAAAVPESDRQTAVAAAVKLADMLGNLADSCQEGASVILLKHAVAHLLPGLQVFCTGVLRGPVPLPCSLTASCSIDVTALAAVPSAAAPACHLFPVMLCTYKRLAALANRQPQLGLTAQLVGNQALAQAASMMTSRYWTCPPVAAAAVQPSNASLTAQYAAQQVVPLLEQLVASAATAAASGGAAGRGLPQLHVSTSADCLVVAKREDFSSGGGSSVCQVGNLQCSADGVCSCGSPKACSDVLTAPALGSGDLRSAACLSGGSVLSRQQQVLLLVSALVQSKLLPETHQLLQQLLAVAEASSSQLEGSGLSVVTAGNTPRAVSAGAAAGGGAFGGSAAMAVPARKARDGKAAGGSPTGSLLRSQVSASQQYLLAYTGSEPPIYGSSAGSQQRSGSRFGPTPPPSSLGIPMPLLQRSTSLGQVAGPANTVGAMRAAAAAAAAAATPAAAVSGSGDAVDCGGLLRGSSWGSFSNAWLGSSGPGDGHLAQDSSVGLGATNSSLGCLAVLTLSDTAPDDSVRSKEAPRAARVCGADVVQLQVRLEAVLLAVGRVVLDLAAGGLLADSQSTRVSGASGGSSSTGGGDEFAAGGLSRIGSGQAAPGGRISYPGSCGSLQLQPSNEDVLANLSNTLAAAQPAAVLPDELRAGSPQLLSDIGSPLSCAEGNSSDGLFPVDLGLAGLAHPDAAQAGPAATAAAEAGDDAAPHDGGLPADVVWRVMCAVTAAAPLLARHCMSLDLEWSSHVLMGCIQPPLVGCWHPGCVNMAGVSEVAAPSKPCTSCKVAVFCSKGCEKAAWSSHTVACSRLAAAASAQLF